MDFSSASQGSREHLFDGLEVARKEKRTSRMVVPFTEKGKTGSGRGWGSGGALQSSVLGM